MYLNKVFLVGRLTRDPEIRVMPSGQQVASFGLATSRTFKDQGGQKQEKTEFHNIVMFGRLAEIASQYLKKGAIALIEGRIQTRDWQDASGVKKYRTEIIAEAMQMGPKSDSQGSGSYQPSESFAPRSSKPASTGSKKAALEPDIPIIEESDDIDVKNIPF